MGETLFAQSDGASLIIEVTPDGTYLYERRVDGFVGDTWHASIAEAKAQANILSSQLIEGWSPVEKIYAKMPKEGTDVWAPVYAEHVNGDIYRIVDCWGEEADVEFGKDTLVRCRAQTLSGGKALVAYEAT